MKYPTTSSPPSLFMLLASMALFGLISQNALAAGTASGTTIGNRATLNYSVDSVSQTAIGSSPTGNILGAGTDTTFVVDNKVNLTVVTNDTTFITVVPGKLAQVTEYTVTNLGNTVQDYALTAANMVNGEVKFTVTDNFDTTNLRVFVESGATAGYQLGEDLATYIDELAADDTKIVYIVVDIPVSRVNGDAALVSLTATTHDGGGASALGSATVDLLAADTSGVDVVFADTAGSDDNAKDGKHSSRSAYKVISAVISVAKTVALICDPFNGNTNPKNIPGAAVQYAVTIANSGDAAATLSTVADTLAGTLEFDPNLINGTGGAAACVTGTSGLADAVGFAAIKGTGATTYAAPGLTAHRVTAGAAISGQAITITYNDLATFGGGVLLTSGSLPAGDFITVYFNVFVK